MEHKIAVVAVSFVVIVIPAGIVAALSIPVVASLQQRYRQRIGSAGHRTT